MFKFKGFLVAMLIFGLVLPFVSSAQSTGEIATTIASLRQQIAALQQQLAQLQGGQTPACFNFNRDLGVRASGREVRELHLALSREGFAVPSSTSNSSIGTERFTEITAASVSAFQLKYQDEILTPLGLTSPTGYVGPSTRAVLNRLYGCSGVKPIIIRPEPSLRSITFGNLPPTISGVSGPTTLQVNQAGTWEVKASDPENGPLYYSVVWGDEPPMSFPAGLYSVPANLFSSRPPLLTLT